MEPDAIEIRNEISQKLKILFFEEHKCGPALASVIHRRCLIYFGLYRAGYSSRYGRCCGCVDTTLFQMENPRVSLSHSR